MKNLFYLLFLAFALSSSSVTAQLCQGIDPEVECDDGDPCTLDICQFGFCQNIPIEPGTPCDDGFENSFNDAYDENCICVGTCDDDNPNTLDLFIDGVGCIFVPLPEGQTVCDTTACADIAADLLNPCSQVFFTTIDGALYCQRVRLNGPLGDIDNSLCTEHECDCGEVVEIGTTCEPGEPDPCHEFVCDPETGNCIQVPVNCDDFNPATYDFCHPEFGCQHVTIPEGRAVCEVIDCESTEAQQAHGLCSVSHILPDGSCVMLLLLGTFDDGDACTVSTSCLCGALLGQDVDCDDNNDCTLDECNSETGECSHTPYWAAQLENLPLPTCYELCGYRVLDSDGNVLEDALDPVNCVADSIALQPSQVFDGNFDDVLICEFVLELHYVLIICDDSDPCTLDSCDPETGNCIHTPINCDDNNIYTIDTCNNGECEHESIWDLEILSIDADDACFYLCNYQILDATNDVFIGWFGEYGNCDGPTGTIEVELDDENGNPLDIVIFYTLKAVDCDDGDPCTLDDCHPLLGCTHTPIIPGTSCDDGNPCTENDTYDAECNCVGTPKNCDDGNPCSEDSCDPVTGICLHVFPSCDDNNPCTIDGCNPETGNCEHLPLWQYIIDNTPSPFCHELCGYIVTDDEGNILDDSGAPVDCEVDVIIPVASQNSDILNIDGPCNYVVLFHYHLNHEACDDGDPCTIDTCDPITGNCTHTPKDCNDNNAYTIDSCDPETGNCVHVYVWQDALDNLLSNNPCFTICNYLVSDATNDVLLGWFGNGTDCGDADQQLIVDTFDENGNAVQLIIFYSTTPTDCDDGDPCTIDSCDDFAGCQHFPVFPGTECDDGDPDTVNDVYLNTPDCECAGVPISPGCVQIAACNYDPFVNTDDGSCLFPGDECDDGDPLTINDSYDLECNCTGDALNIGCPQPEACNYDPNVDVDDGSCLFPGGPCDDGDASTENDQLDDDCNCSGDPISCDDGDIYTEDYIDPETGDCISIHVWDLYLNDLVVPPCYELCGWVLTQGVSIFDSEELIGDCDATSVVEILLQVIDPIDGAVIDLILTLNYREKDCDDENICTIDACDPLTGNCTHTEIVGGEPCDDGDPDTVDDMYNSFCSCVGTPTCKEDLNADGAIDTLDLLQFLGAFGTQCDD
jgi:hypothetical protein